MTPELLKEIEEACKSEEVQIIIRESIANTNSITEKLRESRKVTAEQMHKQFTI